MRRIFHHNGFAGVGNIRLGLYLAALRAAGLPPTAAVTTAQRLGAAGVVPQDLLVALQSRGSFWQRLFAGEGARGAAAGTMVPVSPSPALAWPANAAALPAPVRVPEGPAREAAGACHAGPVPVPSPGSKSAPDPLDLTRLHGWLRAAPRGPVGNAVTVPEAARRPASPVSPW